MKKTLSRRFFIKVLASQLVLAVYANTTGIKIVNASIPKQTLPQGFELNLFLTIAKDETITVIVPHIELGQGTSTGIPMILAEELMADWQKITFRLADAGAEYGLPGSGLQLTGGSQSIRMRYDQLRRAGAAARMMLVKAAAQKWNVPIDQCQAQKGKVKHIPTGREISFGQLSQEASKLEPPPKVSLKKPQDFTIIGQPIKRLDLYDKIQGKTQYGCDISLPDMLRAVIARPPAYKAIPLAYKPEKALAIKGVKKVIALDQGIAVVADSFWAAQKGRRALQVQWSPGVRPNMSSQSIEQTLFKSLETKAITAKEKGKPDLALKKAAQLVEEIFYLPYVSHACPEPLNATALYTKDSCEIWVGTQFQTNALRAASKASGLKPNQVTLHTCFAGGGFGRRLEYEVVVEAVLLAKKFPNTPIQVLWTREDNLKHDVYRPGNVCLIQAGLDDKGNISALKYKVALSSIMKRVWPQALRNGIDRSTVEGAIDMPYAVKNFAVDYVDPDLPIPVGFLRSVGHTHNIYTIECFMDYLAKAANKDPLKFRLGLLNKKPRYEAILKMVAEKAQWGKPLPENWGRGVALSHCYGSYAAHVAEVSHDPNKGSYKVERIICGLDCGQVINPDSVKAQLQGACVMALSMFFKEQVNFAKGGVKTSNYHDYPLLKISETPKIETYLLKSSKDPGGVGEPGVPTVAPSVANAIFAIKGERINRLPFGMG